MKHVTNYLEVVKVTVEEKKTNMVSREFEAPVHLEKSPFQEKIIFPNGCILLLTPDCPPALRDQFIALTKDTGTQWAFTTQVYIDIQKRREVYFPDIKDENGQSPVVKRKKKYMAPENESLKIGYFTSSVVHEVRTSYQLKAVLEGMKTELPLKMNYKERDYTVTYQVQQPWGAVIDPKDLQARFDIYRREPGLSPRDEVSNVDGWNNLDQADRVLFGQIHSALNQLANSAVAAGLEPWDLGVHQVLYHFNHQDKTLLVTILDTEEYNQIERFGSHWTRTFAEIGLAPVLLFL